MENVINNQNINQYSTYLFDVYGVKFKSKVFKDGNGNWLTVEKPHYRIDTVDFKTIREVTPHQVKTIEWLKKEYKSFSNNLLGFNLDNYYKQKETRYLVPIIKEILDERRNNPIKSN